MWELGLRAGSSARKSTGALIYKDVNTLHLAGCAVPAPAGGGFQEWESKEMMCRRAPCYPRKGHGGAWAEPGGLKDKQSL